MKIFYKNIFVGINLFWLTCFTNYCTITICCFKSIFINIPLFLATYFCIYSGVHLNWDSQQGRVRTTSILVWAFWNFKFKVLKYPRNCSLQYTLIPNFWQPLMYMYAYSLFFNCMSLLDPVRLLFITVRHWVIWKLTNS